MDVVNEKTSNKILPYVKSIENGTIRGPISLHILLSDFCVNKCNMCDHWKTEHKNNISLETIKKIWTELNYHDCESVCLTGGDPILHPDFEDILELHREFDLGIICTGNFKKNFNFNLLKTLKWIRFSIDSLDAVKYANIRGLDNLHGTIIPNLKKAQNYVYEVGINFTIQHQNSNEIKDIVNFAAENGIYRLMLYPMHGDNDLCITEEDTRIIISQLEDVMMMNYYKLIPENNLQFLLDNLMLSLKLKKDIRKASFDYKKYPCIINKIHMAIGSDGKVFPCEMIADDTDAYGDRLFNDGNRTYKELGNVNEDDIIDIWNRNFDKTFCSSKCDNCFSRYLPINESYYKNKGKKIFI